MREFFSLDNPKNAETNDDDDQPGADESDSQVTNKLRKELAACCVDLSMSDGRHCQCFTF